VARPKLVGSSISAENITAAHAVPIDDGVNPVGHAELPAFSRAVAGWITDPGAGVGKATGSPRSRVNADRFGEHVNVKDHGALADGSVHALSSRYTTLAEAKLDFPAAAALTEQIDGNAWRSASTRATAAESDITAPAGHYVLTAGVTSVGFTSGDSARLSPPPIRGAGPKSTIIDLGSATGYAFTFTDNYDFAIVQDLQIKAEGAGVFDFSAGMGQSDFSRIEVNGCSGFVWNSNHLNGVFGLHVTNCRIWSENGTFTGGIMRLGDAADPQTPPFVSLNCGIEKSHCTHLDRDGANFELFNSTGFYSAHNEYEATAATNVNQVFHELSGSGSGFQSVGDYIEQPFNTFVKVKAGHSHRSGSITSLYVRGGIANAKILDLSGGGLGSTGWKVDRILYSGDDPGAGTAFLIDDPWHNVEIGYIRNVSGGNQANRLISQAYVAKADGTFTSSHLGSALPAMREAAGGRTKADAGLGAGACTIEVPLLTDVENWKDGTTRDLTKIVSGVYELSASCIDLATNQSTTSSWRVSFFESRNYHVATKIGTDDSDAAGAPTSVTAAVSRYGVLTLSATQAATGGNPHLWRWHWKLLYPLV
jgi:hypothetical protein